MQRLRFYYTTHAGFGHEIEVKGRHLVATMNGSTLVIRIYDKRGRLTRVKTYTQVDWTDYKIKGK